MGHKTPLYEKHQAAGAKLVDFGGWDMPLHYGSQLEEHHYVRNDAGMFDVSHMTVVDVKGNGAYDYLRYLLANDVAKLTTPGKALYTCMLNEQGGVVDDLIVYKLGEQRYRLVVNAATREKDIAWLQQHTQQFAVHLQPRHDLGILAVQGPQAMAKLATVLLEAQFAAVQSLKPFQAVELAQLLIARTGYTGEDGVEIMLPATEITKLWDALLRAEVKPCGLGARDTLRLEAGLNLYGTDMDETTSPLVSNLAWTIAWEPADRHFIGRQALEMQRQHIKQQVVGLILEQRGVLRNHQKITLPEGGEGEITSGSFSPTLQQAVALARIPVSTSAYCFVDIRGQPVKAKIVKPPFVRQGKAVFKEVS
jgi:aminomethyltransferase